mmetsp:Transcript_55465/g.154601  ORF Transcript_55465/g.154601 Transcript_55465/m.154601 type:complete len:240 (+) Transcript_55465:842-1561(+)
MPVSKLLSGAAQRFTHSGRLASCTTVVGMARAVVIVPAMATVITVSWISSKVSASPSALGSARAWSTLSTLLSPLLWAFSSNLSIKAQAWRRAFSAWPKGEKPNSSQAGRALTPAKVAGSSTISSSSASRSCLPTTKANATYNVSLSTCGTNAVWPLSAVSSAMASSAARQYASISGNLLKTCLVESAANTRRRTLVCCAPVGMTKIELAPRSFANESGYSGMSSPLRSRSSMYFSYRA